MRGKAIDSSYLAHFRFEVRALAILLRVSANNFSIH